MAISHVDRVVLIGLRGCGKTTVGRHLAQLLSLPFFDSDSHLTARTGRSPSDWLTHFGEAEFRRVEREAIAELALEPLGVLALGGGAPCTPENRSALREWSTVLLTAPEALLEQRLRTDRDVDRPPLTDLPLAEEIRELSQRRLPDYEAMRPIAVLDTACAVDEVCAQIVAVLPR